METPAKLRAPELDFTATTGALIRRAAQKFAGKPFVVTPRRSASYAQIETASSAFARRLLAAGVGKGTRVATQLPFGADWYVAWLGITRIGALFMPLSTAYKPAELAKVLRQGDVDTLIVGEIDGAVLRPTFLEEAIEGLVAVGPPPPGGLPPPLRLPALPFLRRIWLCGEASLANPPWASRVDPDFCADASSTGISNELLAAAESEVTPADLMVVIYTSGTASEPKGVVHTHGAMVRHGAQVVRYLDLSQRDVVYCGMPLFWVGGISFTSISAMHAGATVLGMDRLDAGVALDLMEREGATVMTGWPAVTGPVMAHPSLKSRNIPAINHPWFAPGVPRKHHSLGMSETCGPHTGCFADTRSRPVPEGHVNSMGVEMPYIAHRIVDPDTGALLPDGQRGAIHVRGYSLMNGLLKKEREEVFEPDGFYNTGDEGYFLDGLLFLTGRLTDMIKTSGNNVAPVEVEKALAGHPGVLQAYVTGVPDPGRGEIVGAAIVPRAGSPLSASALRDELRKSLSNYKVPRKFIFLEASEVPYLGSGKVDKRAIKRLLEERTGEPL